MLSEILALDPARLGLLGIVLSALVASLGYYGKTRHERRKTRRVVMFYLLRLQEVALWEVRAAAHLPGTLVGTIEDALQRYKMPLAASLKSELVREASLSLAAFLRNRTESMNCALLPSLEKALVDLAKDDPLLASRIAEGLPEVGPPGSRPPDSRHGSVDESSQFAITFSAEMTSSSRASSLRRITSALRIAAFECSLWSWIDVELKLWLQPRWKPPEGTWQPVTTAVDELVCTVTARVLKQAESGNQTPAPTSET